jgi:branched-chain amino acid transport system ATP-binding protein
MVDPGTGQAAAGTPLLETRGLSKSFGGLQVTRQISLSLYPGERVGLIGPNGAGKTTLVNLVTGVLAPSAGTVLLGGEDVTGLEQPLRVSRGLARTFQITQLAPRIPVHRQVEMAIHQREGSINRLLRPLDDFTNVAAEAARILQVLRLEALTQRRPVELAYGEQRLVEIALALALRPRVLLLDEPMAGVPAGERQVILDALAALPRELAILMIEHDMGLVFSFASRIVVMAEGAVLADGAPEAIRVHPAVRAVYLGAAA